MKRFHVNTFQGPLKALEHKTKISTDADACRNPFLLRFETPAVAYLAPRLTLIVRGRVGILGETSSHNVSFVQIKETCAKKCPTW